jgi:hypothetical protein
MVLSIHGPVNTDAMAQYNWLCNIALVVEI